MPIDPCAVSRTRQGLLVDRDGSGRVGSWELGVGSWELEGRGDWGTGGLGDKELFITLYPLPFTHYLLPITFYPLPFPLYPFPFPPENLKPKA